MAKNKSVQKSSKDAQVKSLSSVKEGAVTKPSQTPKSKSKEMAKQVAVKADKGDKKSKKTKKEPTPVSSSESVSEDEEASSASSASSDKEEAPAPKAAKTNGVKANGVAKAAAKAESSSDSSASDDDEDELTTPKSTPAAAGKATVAGAKENSDSEGTSEGTSAGSSDEESDEEVEAPGAIDAKKLNGKLEKVASKEATSEEESGSEGTSSGTSESSSDEESEVEAPAPKKRKAEAEATPVSKKAKTDPGNDDAAKKNLFVGQLSWNVDEEWLTREFESFGELATVRIVTDRETGRSRGFGYVEFVSADDGVKAQAAMHQTELDGRTINVDFSKPKPEGNTPRGADRKQSYGDSVSEKSDTLFVANLSFEATEDVVGEEFGKHGNVLGVRLPTDMDSGAPKGFGYVQFGSVDEAEEAFGKMTGAMIMGRPIRLDYSTPRPPRNNDSPGGRGRGRGGFNDRGGRGGGRGRGGFDRGGRGGGRGGFDRGRGGRGGSTNRGGFGDFKGKKQTFE